MKRMLRIALTFLLLVALTLPAFASDTTDQRLTQVTLAVKKALNIDNSYDTFYSDLEENSFQIFWSLNWETEDRSIQVSAGEDGKIYSYNFRAEGTSDAAPLSFPTYTQEHAMGAAQTFLGQVLTAPESASLTAEDVFLSSARDRYTFHSQLRIYGYETPIGISISVDAATGQVIRYNRDDRYEVYLSQQYTNPASMSLVGTSKAGQSLRSTLSLRLEYVLDEGSDTAVLRYLPDTTDTYYVDAKTGELINLTQLYKDLGATNGGAAGDTGDSSAAEDGLSEAEQAGIAQMAGVQSRETLDKAARSYTALGLTGYTLDSCTYTLNRDTGAVTARLQYAIEDDGYYIRRTVSLDAKSASLLSASGRTWADEDFQVAVTPDAAKATAEAFLSDLWSKEFASCALYDSIAAQSGDGSRVHIFTYAQKVNGYFFPENQITIAVDAATGAVTNLYRSFDATPKFDSTIGILTAEQAMDAWFDTYTVTLGYLQVPEDLLQYGDRYETFLETGYTSVFKLQLGYALSQESNLLGIDAKTGKAVLRENSAVPSITYSDLGSTGKVEAETLASYGIGWLGGKLQPDKQLTQLDLVALLASTDGYLVDLSEKDAAEQLYQYAYSAGLLTAKERNDNKTISRGELVKALLDCSGFGEAAQISGIFRCTFTDSIPDDLYGYAAIAQGLQMVSGTTFSSSRSATRLEALTMLYRLMSR